MSKINIAIDGYSSCGKSTLAKQMAKALDYTYVDSGAMYRAVALFAKRNGWVEEGRLDQEALVAALNNIEVSFSKAANGMGRTLLNGEDVEGEIREMAVSKVVSLVSTVPEVRAKLVQLQQAIGRDKGVVMDGRDIGTVVFPNAELKLFMKADAEVRAKRRFDELSAKGVEVTLDEIISNVRQRDHQDENRTHDPLRLADDAVVIDNSNLGPEAQFQQAMKLVDGLLVD